ncbi:hypothetical protein OSB04_023418 [Centaurea solstitialis]|uniref:CCHC-type domain-containing protein n=1 Tax=Centaurea solstitialis TaxID=347529 RepID=A0AA38WCW5_9ASTR|nr:hypothetical protein OSB04_023418 [Centaurea solstitialis]
MSAEDKTLSVVPRFDGHYDHWAELMENFLRAKGLWSCVEHGVVARGGVTLEDAKTKDHQVKHYLFQAIDRNVFQQILDCRTAKIVWDSMKVKFGGSAKVKKSLLNSLRREFEILVMKNEETVTDYFARVMSVANQMRSNGEVLTDRKIVEKILRNLTERFTYVVVSIEEAKDTDNMTVDELQSTLLVHEQKFRKVSNEGEDQVLKVESRFGSRGRAAVQKGRGRAMVPRGRGQTRGGGMFGRGHGGAISKATAECYKCHKLGHLQYECPTWDKEANYVEIEEDEEMLLMAHVELSEDRKSTVWFVDSDDTKLLVRGKGVVTIALNGIIYNISDVYYVPKLKNN